MIIGVFLCNPSETKLIKNNTDLIGWLLEVIGSKKLAGVFVCSAPRLHTYSCDYESLQCLWCIQYFMAVLG